MPTSKQTVTRRKAPNTVTLENSRYRDHFELVADSVLLEFESRAQFFKNIAGLIEEFQPANFVESLQLASMAAARWRQLRYCAMFASVSASDWADRARLLDVLAFRERHCKRAYDRNRKWLIELIAKRVNNVGGPAKRKAA